MRFQNGPLTRLLCLVPEPWRNHTQRPGFTRPAAFESGLPRTWNRDMGASGLLPQTPFPPLPFPIFRPRILSLVKPAFQTDSRGNSLGAFGPEERRLPSLDSGPMTRRKLLPAPPRGARGGLLHPRRKNLARTTKSTTPLFVRNSFRILWSRTNAIKRCIRVC